MLLPMTAADAGSSAEGDVGRFVEQPTVAKAKTPTAKNRVMMRLSIGFPEAVVPTSSKTAAVCRTVSNAMMSAESPAAVGGVSRSYARDASIQGLVLQVGDLTFDLRELQIPKLAEGFNGDERRDCLEG